MTTDRPATLCVVLAGGLGRRMGGGDKPMREIGGRTILDHVIERLEPQSDEMVLNANGDPARFARFGLPVVADTIEGYPGPLAGILAAVEWTAANRPGVEWVASAAGDCPFLPRDLVARLQQARSAEGADLAVAASWSKTIRSWPESAVNRLPRARPTSVSPTSRASATPQAVNPEREIRMGMPIRTVLIVISEVNRPVV